MQDWRGLIAIARRRLWRQRLLDATSGIQVLSSTEPAPGRRIELSGTVAKRVGRIGVGLVDVRGRSLKLLTVRCTTA